MRRPAPRLGFCRRVCLDRKHRALDARRLRAGADIVELDVHPTSDGQFAVFHDWTLDCRSDGRGVTRERSLAELKQLDVGHGYTADGGKSFPLRGTGIGLLPSLDEVLGAFPDNRFLSGITSFDFPPRPAGLPGLIAAAEQLLLLIDLWRCAAVAAARHTARNSHDVGIARLKRCLIRYVLLALVRIRHRSTASAACCWSGRIMRRRLWACRTGFVRRG